MVEESVKVDNIITNLVPAVTLSSLLVFVMTCVPFMRGGERVWRRDERTEGRGTEGPFGAPHVCY